MGVKAARGRAATLLAGIRAGGSNLHRLPKRVFSTLSGRDGSGIWGDSSTYRCGGSAG